MGSYLFKADDADLARWKADAKDAGYSFAEWIRARLDAKPEVVVREVTAASVAAVAPGVVPPFVVRNAGTLAAPSVPGQKRSYEPDFKEPAKGKRP